MRTLSLLILAAFAFPPAHANTPRKEPLVKYTGLWTNSPFTTPKPVVEGTPAANPFEDFTLTGIAPVPGGHRITIMSKKNPDIKRVIEPGGSDEFKVVSVDRNPEKALGTTVVLSSGSVQGTVSFEPELITLQAAPAAAAENEEEQTITPPTNTAPNNPNPPPGMRSPRPRIVPPPTPGANQQQQKQPSGDRRDSRRR